MWKFLIFDAPPVGSFRSRCVWCRPTCTIACWACSFRCRDGSHHRWYTLPQRGDMRLPPTPPSTMSQRRSTSMDIAHAQQFLRENDNAVLATWRRDGRLQMSPVTVGLDGAGRAISSSQDTTAKVRNLRRDPRATLCVFVEAFRGPWVQLEGTAEIVTLPEAMEPLVDYYRRLAGEHPDWDDYRRAMTADRRALILITIERAGPDRQG